MVKRKRKRRAYTVVGHRMAALGKRQVDLARVLGVSQQTTSKKLRGECAILLADLQRLAKHYKVPMAYFFEDEAKTPGLADAWQRIQKMPGPHHELVVLASTLPAARVRQLVRKAQPASARR